MSAVSSAIDWLDLSGASDAHGEEKTVPALEQSVDERGRRCMEDIRQRRLVWEDVGELELFARLGTAACVGDLQRVRRCDYGVPTSGGVA